MVIAAAHVSRKNDSTRPWVRLITVRLTTGPAGAPGVTKIA